MPLRLCDDPEGVSWDMLSHADERTSRFGACAAECAAAPKGALPYPHVKPKRPPIQRQPPDRLKAGPIVTRRELSTLFVEESFNRSQEPRHDRLSFLALRLPRDSKSKGDLWISFPISFPVTTSAARKLVGAAGFAVLSLRH